MNGEIAVVGGAGYTGREIVSLLLKAGRSGIRVLTGHPDRPHPFGGSVKIYGLEFGDPFTIREALRGVRVLYNTY